ncbi:MAG: flagellar basal-body rod modification protein FlgD [Candidatus Endobugula sp.]|jgi:flagellar basal-body rod modification protein FlgD
MINSIADNSFLNSLGVQTRKEEEVAAAEASGDELGQTAFLELMITQMENQDPLSPQENSDFIAQLAQFSSVEGLERLNTNFDSFTSSFISNQALQASSLVGRSVSVPSSEAALSEGGFVGGSIDLPASTTSMSMGIYNSQGTLVEQIPMGAQSAGDIIFRWDGNRMEVNGELSAWESENPITSGDYSFEVIATQNGEPEQLSTALTANVNSVTSGANGQLILNLSGLGAVSINDVKQFN